MLILTSPMPTFVAVVEAQIDFRKMRDAAGRRRVQHEIAAIVKIGRMKRGAQGSGSVLQHGKRDVAIDQSST